MNAEYSKMQAVDDDTLFKIMNEIDFEIDSNALHISYARYKELRDCKEKILHELEKRGYSI